MMDEFTQENASEGIEGGKLPNRRPDRIWGGPGVGADCILCREPVTCDEVEFEVEFARNGTHPGVDRYHVHVRCWTAWESNAEN